MPRSNFVAALLLAAPTLALMAGCTSDITNVGSNFPGEDELTQVATNIPFTGRCETSFTFTGPTTLQIASVCQLLGIGRVTGLAQQTLDFSQVAQTGLIGITNTSVYTAPNGEQLFASFTGSGSQVGVTVDFVGVETFTGGTGRFSNVAGSTDLLGAANVETLTGYFTTTEKAPEAECSSPRTMVRCSPRSPCPALRPRACLIS